MIDQVNDRRPHAILDLESRKLKATKIERLLGLDRLSPRNFRLLEIGCGSGGIAHYFATHPVFDCNVHAVDVVDNRVVTEGFDFKLVQDTSLPFPDSYFDFVITNHVIEHVGDTRAQKRHLAEVHRVMKTTAIAYLAVPNRWQLVEPHYHLAFLSWVPHALRTPYLRVMRRGKFYDCEPLTTSTLERLLRSEGFVFENLCVQAMDVTLQLEQPESLLRTIIGCVPVRFKEAIRSAIPTLIYRLTLPAESL